MKHQHQTKRRAVTLLELLLVLAMLVAIAGLAAPTFDSMVTSRRLSQSIRQLHNDLMAARVTAMRTGQAQVLRATLQTADYSITPWLGGTEAQDASVGATIVSTSGEVVETTQGGNGTVATSAPQTQNSKALSTGVTFSAVETLIDSRNANEIEKSGETLPASGTSATSSGISSPLLLYPDGSTTTAQIVLVDTKGRRMAIQVRGVTGQLSTLQLVSVDPSTITPAP